MLLNIDNRILQIVLNRMRFSDDWLCVGEFLCHFDDCIAWYLAVMGGTGMVDDMRLEFFTEVFDRAQDRFRGSLTHAAETDLR